MNFLEKYREAVENKNSILCVGLDPAEFGQREKNTIPEGADKLGSLSRLIEGVSPFCAAVKVNRNYVKDLSREELGEVVACAHNGGLIVIDDSKLADIGSTNDSGLYHAQQEGFDAVTYAPFPGNTEEAVNQAHKRGLALISLVLMSNPEFEARKRLMLDGKMLYEILAEEVKEYGVDGIVIGAPSPANHITEEEVERVRDIVGERFVLVPGIGAQGGQADYLIKTFGSGLAINVGRSIMYSDDPVAAAERYRDMFNKLRREYGV